MKKLLALLCITFILQGCSNQVTPESPLPTETPAPNTLTVGMECNYAPFNWTQSNASDTAVQVTSADYCDGYDVVMAQKIADNLGKTLVIKPIPWDGLILALNNDEVDAIIAGMTATDDRRIGADFTEPYYESSMVMVVRSSDTALVNASSIQDFSGYKVLGQVNTIYDEIIPQIIGVTHMTPQASYPRMVLSLQQNEVDALTAELPVAQGVVAANSGLSIVTFDEGKGFEADTSVSIAIKKGNTDLLNQIQIALNSISPETRNTIMIDATNRQPASE